MMTVQRWTCPLLVAGVWSIFTARSASAGYTALDLYTLSAPSLSFGFPKVADTAAGQQVVSEGPVAPPVTIHHALLWTAAGRIIDLNPAGFTYSSAFGSDGVHQVGSGYGPGTANIYHALMWNGSSDSAVDLNPSGFVSSYAIGVGGTQQVGSASTLPSVTNGLHAMLWTGTAQSAVDLSPAGFAESEAHGTDGQHQVGIGLTFGTNLPHALIWAGSAASAVDLNPSGFDRSFANGVRGVQAVGSGENLSGTINHALLWNGSASSVVDLNPVGSSGIIDSTAYGTNGTVQVGYGFTTTFASHALLWRGTSDSAVDLNSLLPSGFDQSVAYTVDSAGNAFGLALDSSGKYHAIEWVVPEPSALSLLPFAAIMLRRRRRDGLSAIPGEIAAPALLGSRCDATTLKRWKHG